ncbi:MAG: alpha/beta hydrolase [Flavobacteriales bacterium]|nr:alpha/beta hydrolase [Flavobacteriales bacterium]
MRTGSLLLLGLLHLTTTTLIAQQPTAWKLPYGDNAAAGHRVKLNGVELYYETYGEGEPLVLLHGNSGNIGYMAPQIDHFAGRYKVIALDCRGRGKSELGPDSLTYMAQAEDLNALLDHLHIDSTLIIGRSDGAVVALLMGIHYPQKVKRIAAFGANVSPDTTALYSFQSILDERRNADKMLAAGDTTKNWKVVQQRFRMMEFQPHITAAELGRIQCPVLVLTTDRDLIKEEHSMLIYRSIPKANLCIFPGASHRITKEDPALFNATVERYFTEPYKGEEIRK